MTITSMWIAIGILYIWVYSKPSAQDVEDEITSAQAMMIKTLHQYSLQVDQAVEDVHVTVGDLAAFVRRHFKE